MKIIHVVRTLDPAEGGPPHVAVRLAAAQAAGEHEVHLVHYARTDSQTRVGDQMARIPHRERIHLHPLFDPGRIEGATGVLARARLREIVPGAAFVHVHGLWGAILRQAAAAARREGVPYAIRPAGMLDPWSLGQKRWKKRIALAFGYRRMLDGAAFIHALNDDERRLLGPLGLRAPVEVISNGIFVQEISPLPPPGSFRAAHPALGGAPFVLFLSRLHTKKGLDILAQSFALLARDRADVRLVVAGPDDGARADFLARAAGSGFGDRIHVVGPLYGRDKLAALADAACFCLPSRQEGFSVAILEAMACGRPVVISQACHFPEVADAGAGRVVPLDAQAIASALGDFLANPAAAQRAGRAGAELVRARYTWEAVATHCLTLYQRHHALNEPPASPDA